ncbi:MAG: hypothetical protein AVDCRST_MAG42-25 [uncultured Chthoniobacterales bacterium]|uniref:DUF642 domain-containing protein n=1 Tax=uncultured Chthoniobacterales bacterium TaxID=1836801 RepID=A0A6J4H3W5_9BACT|nr:MAG: hypothetical protein AVDCRST_MAG42-25 [uncultured Chthoniobacterales bacterium]
MNIRRAAPPIVSRVHRIAVAVMLFAGAAGLFAKEEKKGPDLGSIVKDLYAAHQNGSALFNQTKDRKLLDRFFTKEIADKLWKDAVAADGEIGALDFDPLYGSQDPQITKFKVGETNYGKHHRSGDFITYEGFAIVDVTFTAGGKPMYVMYQVQTEGADKGKISNITYNDGTSLVDALNPETHAAAPEPKASSSQPKRSNSSAASPSTANANLLVNGNFATGDFTGWETKLTPKSGPYSGPNLGVNKTRYKGGFRAGFNGGDSVVGASIAQTFATLPGETYQLTFDYLTGGGPGKPQKMQVIVSDSDFEPVKVAPPGDKNVTYTYSFVPKGTITTVTFQDDAANSTVSIDGLLGPVQITQLRP